MTAVEKAKDLVEKFNYESKHFLMLDSKQCALIAVDECIKYEQKIRTQIQSVNFPNSFIIILNDGVFWEEVKNEISNL